MDYNLTVGQTLWLVSNSNRTQTEVTITKIGRKYATLSNKLRLDKITKNVFCKIYGCVGTCYLSKNNYDCSKALQISWENFTRKLYGTPCPKKMTLERLEEIKTIVFEVIDGDKKYTADGRIKSIRRSNESDIFAK